MKATVVGLYDNETAAERAARSLNEQGFSENKIHIEAHGAEDSSSSTSRSHLSDLLDDAGVPDDEASYFVEGVEQGGSLLILETTEEREEDAARLMNTREPVENRRSQTRSSQMRSSETRSSQARSSEARSSETSSSRASSSNGSSRRDAYRTHYERTYADTDRDYSAYEPAYEQGYRYGSNDSFQNRSYDEVRPRLKDQYETRNGEGTFEHVKEAIRHGFQRGRSSV